MWATGREAPACLLPSLWLSRLAAPRTPVWAHAWPLILLCVLNGVPLSARCPASPRSPVAALRGSVVHGPLHSPWERESWACQRPEAAGVVAGGAVCEGDPASWGFGPPGCRSPLVTWRRLRPQDPAGEDSAVPAHPVHRPAEQPRQGPHGESAAAPNPSTARTLPAAGPTRDKHGALGCCLSLKWLWLWLRGGWVSSVVVSGAEPASSRLAPGHLHPQGGLGWQQH